MKGWRRDGSAIRGQSTIEFIIVFFCFVAFLFLLSDLTVLCYKWLSIQYACHKGARYSKTVPDDSPIARDVATKTEVLRIANSLGVGLADVDVTVTVSNGNLRIDVDHKVHVNPLTGVLLLAAGDYSGDYEIKITEVVRNEEFGKPFS